MKNHNDIFELPDSKNEKLLAEVAKEFDVDLLLINQLIEMEKAKVHLQRRRGVKGEIIRLIENYLNKK